MDKNLFSIRKDILSDRNGLNLNSKAILQMLLNCNYVAKNHELTVKGSYFEKSLGLTGRKVERGLLSLRNKGFIELYLSPVGVYRVSMKDRINDFYEGACLYPEKPQMRANHKGELTEEETEDYIREARGTYKLRYPKC